MKNGKWICLFIIGLILVTAASSFSNTNFKRLLTESIIDFYNLEKYDIEIDIRSSRFDIDSLIFDSLAIRPMTNSKPRGLLAFKVSLFNEGREIKKGQVRVKIAYFENVLVATDRIGRHQSITFENSKLERMEITSLTSRPLTSENSLADLWAKRDIRKGQILSSGSVEKIPTVLSGQGVSILYKSNTLEISAKGVAMESGYIGDKIRIKNEQSRKILTGTILDSETVEIAAY
ncbi:MAG: flagella basal body P-ring formation protein FlgA [Candidatus Zixiibacteriota bacterium]|nr:MAG: flagella basal body P-ring formation protein FlgA [candidate division Zixibacteria bacterium]HHI02410.1 flagellar basal body P-ring formation protein FlgA [candidate division Zixibacteria bacterium]